MSNLHHFPEYASQSQSTQSHISCSKCTSVRVVSTKNDSITTTHVCFDCRNTWYQCVPCTHKRSVSSTRRKSIFESLKQLKRHKSSFREDHKLASTPFNDTVRENLNCISSTMEDQNYYSHEECTTELDVTNEITNEKQFWRHLMPVQ